MNKTLLAKISGVLLALALLIFKANDLLATTDYGLSNVKSKGLLESEWWVVVGRVLQGIFGIIGVLLLVMIIYGGILYMTAAGSEDRVESAKKILTYAIFGAVVVALAFTITTYIINALFSKGSGTTLLDFLRWG